MLTVNVSCQHSTALTNTEKDKKQPILKTVVTSLTFVFCIHVTDNPYSTHTGETNDMPGFV